VTEPAITVRAFFERVRAGQLVAIRCESCGQLAIPPRELCPTCHARAWQPQSLAGDGTIASYTVIRVAPRSHAAEAPYAVAVVTLKEGVAVLGRIVDIPLGSLAIGMPVRFRPLVVSDQASIGFGPA